MPYILVPCLKNSDWTREEWTGSKDGIERIELDIENPEEFKITQVFWGGNYGWIRFNVDVKIEKIDAVNTEVGIEYLEKNNKHLFDKYPEDAKAIVWGRHVLTLTRGKSNGPSVWKAEGEKSCDGPGWKLEKIAGGQTNRRRSAIWAIQRDEQSIFRQHLLATDERCALTGEDCEKALEAAHIIPAHRGGREVLSNGILLRADIHRLYDACPPIFSICPDTGKVSSSGTYGSFDFQNTKIPEQVRYRITDALRKKKKYAQRTGRGRR